MAEIQYEKVLFSGRVQGVGFRYTTLQVAKEFEVAGQVQNLVDGRVRVDIEGEPREVASFIDALEERMYGYIRKTERNSIRREALFRGFSIL